MSKLTKAQRRMLESVADGEVHLHFDVWAGYWWTERDKKLPVFSHRTDAFPPLPIRYLLEGKLIEKRETERVYSGRHRTPIALTDKGREALREQS